MEITAPPIPADADLRHMPGYMIDVQSLLGSDLAAFGDPAANWYAVMAWCAALHQVPAGSLPDDDGKLAYLVRLGRDIKTWRRFRARGALHGWVKFSDGRLYHPAVTANVLNTLRKSQAGKIAAAVKQGRPPPEIQSFSFDPNLFEVPQFLWPASSNHREGSYIQVDVRRAVLIRDGRICRYCTSTDGPFHFDHVVPWSRGGQSNLENIAVACESCNLKKGAKTPAEWQDLQKQVEPDASAELVTA